MGRDGLLGEKQERALIRPRWRRNAGSQDPIKRRALGGRRQSGVRHRRRVAAWLERERGLGVPHQGEPYRVLYAFDPRRTALLLVGGKKTGDDRWYDTFVPLADRRYDEHLETLKKE
ncbi:MAG: hypothetical protein EA420_01755, partial [Candidatus Competibacteraceae bacterium]